MTLNTFLLHVQQKKEAIEQQAFHAELLLSICTE